MKKRLIEEMRQRDEKLSERAAGTMIDDVFGAVQGVLDRGEKVSLQGFGTFERAYRAERTGRNPQTGETIKIAGRHATKFREARQQKR